MGEGTAHCLRLVDTARRHFEFIVLRPVACEHLVFVRFDGMHALAVICIANGIENRELERALRTGIGK